MHWPALRPRTTKSASPPNWRSPTCRLQQFLDEPIIPYETDEVTRLIVDTHDAAAFDAGRRPDRRRVSRLAAALRNDGRDADAHSRPGLTPEMVAAVSKLMRNQDLILVGQQVPRRHAVSQHDRPARPALDSAAAQSSDGRSGRHRRVDSRRPAVRLRRRGDRHQPGHRLGRNRHPPARHAGRADRAVRDSHAVVRAGPRHDAARRDRARRAGRPGVSIDRRHRSGQRQLWRQS